jgi:glycosyltransferase involved in cell wall biosynthesis
MIKTGGAEKQLLLLANILSGTCFKVYVLVNDIDHDFLQLFGKNVEIKRIPSYQYLLQILWMRKFIYKMKIDVCHAWDFKSSIIGFAGTIFSDSNFIDGSIRSAYAKSAKNYRIYKLKYQLFRLLGVTIISNSAAGLKNYSLTKYHKAHVIYNGIDQVMQQSSTNAAAKNKVTSYKIGMVANMRWKKDFLTFIKAGIEVLKSREDVVFYLVGDGVDKPKYQNYIKDFGKKREKFIFTGHCKNPGNYIRQMDICVLANCESGEGLSNSIMEYMLYGKPVIATNLGGNNELVREGVTGYLIDELDYQQLALKILYLLNRPVEREYMGRKGREIMLTKFTVENMVCKYRDLYNKVINKFPPLCN